MTGTYGNQTAFKEGVSPNPSGRPKGAKDRRRELIALFDNAAPELVQNAIDLANAGDAQLMRVCMERILPKLREVSYVKIKGICGKTYAEKCTILDESLENEFITMQDWECMHKTFSRCFEIDEIDRRLTLLEESAKK